MLIDQIASLEQQIRETKNLKERVRLCAVLGNANGHPIKLISSVLQISVSSVYGYINEFNRFNKTRSKKYLGRACKMSSLQEVELTEYVLKNSYKSVKALSVYVKEKFNIAYSSSGMREWLRKKNLQKKYGVFLQRNNKVD